MAKTQFTTQAKQLSPKKLLGAIVALVAAFLLGTSVFSVAGKYIAIRGHIRELEQEQAVLSQKHASLVKTNAYLATADGEEQILRNKYNVVKPGEGMILVIPPDTGKAPIPEPSRMSRWWNSLLSGVGIGRDE